MRGVIIGFLLALIVGVAGCGSGGLSSAVLGSSNSPFAGNFSGTWTDTTTKHNGTAQITVADNGNVTGTIVDSTSNINGALSGDISSAGVASMSETNLSTSSTTSLTGTFAFAANKQLDGSLQQYNAKQLVGTPAFTFTKQ